ncbi:hypothetical protein EJI20_07575 [Salmonella enterica subsp. enterica serovar Napoli]|nr:hypothetical protein [Salmonella enterica subsp. enterica serovar Napoli]
MIKFFFISFLRIILWGCAVCCIGFALLLFISPGLALWQVCFATIGVLTIIGLRKTLALRKSKNDKFIKHFYCDIFQPQNNFTIKRLDIGHYLGIDTDTGNILMISRLEKIFKGDNCINLMGYRRNGSVLTLKFSNLTFPFFKAYFGSELECTEYCHRLDVLLSAQYRPTKESNIDFDTFVKNKLQTA